MQGVVRGGVVSTQGHGGEEESVLFAIRIKDALLKEGGRDEHVYQVTTTVLVPSQVVKIAYRYFELLLSLNLHEKLNGC
mgnify:CR=1 FL=1